MGSIPIVSLPLRPVFLRSNAEGRTNSRGSDREGIPSERHVPGVPGEEPEPLGADPRVREDEDEFHQDSPGGQSDR